MIDLNKTWINTNTDNPPNKKEVPDGNYDCTLKDVSINESKKGNTGVAWHFTDNRSGEKIFKWHSLWNNETQDDEGVVGNNMYWLKKDMAMLGLSCKSFDQAKYLLRTMVGATVRLEIKTKDGFRNINIVEKLADPVRSPGGNPSDNETPDDDVPF